MDTNERKPDLLDQAGELLKRFGKGEVVGHALYPERNSAIVIASAVLAVAGELRDIHNVLHEINGHMAVSVYGADALPHAVDEVPA